MAVPARAVEKSVFTGDSGDSRAMHLHKPCGYAACQELGITSLGDEDLCCDHFVLRCYEFLQDVEGERSTRERDVTVSSALLGTVNSCLQGALDASLRSSSLSNLQKARLLDIMLWAGEYIHREERRVAGHNMPENSRGKQSVSPRDTYRKPQIKSRTTLLPQ